MEMTRELVVRAIHSSEISFRFDVVVQNVSRLVAYSSPFFFISCAFPLFFKPLRFLLFFKPFLLLVQHCSGFTVSPCRAAKATTFESCRALLNSTSSKVTL
jgi:hypothetical protein